MHQRVELRFDAMRCGSLTAARWSRRYPCSYVAGTWQPAPVMCPEPPTPAPVVAIVAPEIVAPALVDYAELCA